MSKALDLRRRLRRSHLANCVRECDVPAAAFPAVASGATEGQTRSDTAAERAAYAESAQAQHAI
eukprot:277554-Pyramimonas_sp.AAC.1